MITLKKECLLEDNDIYILEYHKEVLIVNNNYSGIHLYSKDLVLQNTINIFEGILIHDVYTNPHKNEIILYCPDNEVFVYINLDTSFQKTINFLEGMDEYGLSNIYFWSGNEVIFLCDNKTYYKIDIDFFSLQKLSRQVIKKDYPSFHTLLSDLSEYTVLNSDAETFMCIDKNYNELFYLDYTNKIKSSISFSSKLGHEVIYLQGVFLVVHEEFIQVIKEGEEIARLDTLTTYIFLRVRKTIEKRGEFIVLRGDKANPQNCILSRYEIIC